MRRAVAPSRAPETIHQPTIDRALRVVDRERYRLATRLTHAPPPPRSLANLRTGPLGRDLQRLALVADGRIEEPQERVLAAIDSVLHLLYWSVGSDEHGVPRAFWCTDLGRMLARAKYRTFASKELVGIGAAAYQLGVSRPTIYRWMDDGSLDSVHDDRSGRTFVVRNGIDRRQQAVAAPPRSGDDPVSGRAGRPLDAGDEVIEQAGLDGQEAEGGATAGERDTVRQSR